MTTATDDEASGPSFIEWLQEHHHGDTVDDLDAALRDVVTAVQTYGKSGRLTFTIEVGTKGRTITVIAETKTKVPGEPATADIFFADNEGALHRKDPYQLELPANVVPIDDAEARIVESDPKVRKVGQSS